MKTWVKLLLISILILLGIFYSFRIAYYGLMVIIIALIVLVVAGILIIKSNSKILIGFIVGVCILLAFNSFLWYRAVDSNFYSTGNPLMKEYDLECKNERDKYGYISDPQEKLNSCIKDQVSQKGFIVEFKESGGIISPDSDNLEFQRTFNEAIPFCKSNEYINAHLPASTSCLMEHYNKRSGFSKALDKIKEIIYVIVFLSWQPMVSPG